MFKIFSIFCLLTFANAFAGERGNGGGIHFCENSTNHELYDLFEGRERYDLSIIDGISGSVEDYVNIGLNRVYGKSMFLESVISKEIKSLKEKIIFKQKLKILDSEDANVLIVNDHCSYQQIVNWDDVTGKVFINENLYKTMSEMNKAALLFHEAIYKILRDKLGDKNSDRSRRIVAEIFSDDENIESLKKISILLPPPFQVEVLSSARSQFTEVSSSSNAVNVYLHVAHRNFFDDGNLKVVVNLTFPDAIARKNELRAYWANDKRVRDEISNLRYAGKLSQQQQHQLAELQKELSDLNLQFSQAHRDTYELMSLDENGHLLQSFYGPINFKLQLANLKFFKQFSGSVSVTLDGNILMEKEVSGLLESRATFLDINVKVTQNPHTSVL